MTFAGVIARAGSQLLARLPLPWIATLSGGVAQLGWWLAKSRRNVALTNLRLCFPHKSEAEREIIARTHFRAYVQAALEHGFLWNASGERIRAYVSLHDEFEWKKFRTGDEQRPVIWLCPHFIGLDSAAIRISVDTSGCSLYSEQSNPDIDAMMLAGRTRFGESKIIARTEGVKPIIRAMKSGLPFYYLPDMDFGLRDSVFVPFFGVNAATITGVSRLAKLTHAAVVPVIVTQRPKGAGYDVRFYPAFENFPSGDDVADAKTVNEFIEHRVLENIPQYLWTHKRFKTRPPGEKSVYG
ncbi:MAG: lipid A biosynthesis acyltransferase [Betaproteobacteria bacterium]|nr:MAG: lipid A biosynthesis acyltransferase [Betaproteobacteria bacterium]